MAECPPSFRLWGKWCPVVSGRRYSLLFSSRPGGPFCSPGLGGYLKCIGSGVYACFISTQYWGDPVFRGKACKGGEDRGSGALARGRWCATLTAAVPGHTGEQVSCRHLCLEFCGVSTSVFPDFCISESWVFPHHLSVFHKPMSDKKGFTGRAQAFHMS